ncbi:hypothetical protein ACFL1G_07800 [Planctomycetota bacterium]
MSNGKHHNSTVNWIKGLAAIFVGLLVVGATVTADESAVRNDLLENGVFVQIPGPNPILLPGSDGAWDSHIIETADAIKDLGTYYLFYHGVGNDERYDGKGYQLGLAMSQHPLGPFKKYGDKPVLEAGPEGSWDSVHAACAMVLKEGLDRYYMWYSGYGGSEWDIGLATADNMLGPWEKHESNPIMKDFGYVGGVVKVKDKYFMYNEHPIGSTGDDYGPMSLAVAEKPEGPWTEYVGNPVMLQGEWGEWDDGGISEAEVIYHSGVFHLFYGGSKLFSPRIATRECIGYAYSYDGYNFTKYGLNPIVTRMANPNAASFSEVHAIFESPFVYLYHTLRYKQQWRYGDKDRVPPGAEDIGVQVLVTQKPFRIDMPVLTLDSLAPGEKVTLNNTPPVNLSQITSLLLTAQCRYAEKAKKALRVHIVASTDGVTYDTVDLFTLDNELVSGELVRKSFELESKAKYIKVLVENLDNKETLEDVQIILILGG